MKFCGLVFFGLLLAGICPTRQVELEGLVPYTPTYPISSSCAFNIFLCAILVPKLSKTVFSI